MRISFIFNSAILQGKSEIEFFSGISVNIFWIFSTIKLYFSNSPKPTDSKPTDPKPIKSKTMDQTNKGKKKDGFFRKFCHTLKDKRSSSKWIQLFETNIFFLKQDSRLIYDNGRMEKNIRLFIIFFKLTHEILSKFNQ